MSDDNKKKSIYRMMYGRREIVTDALSVDLGNVMSVLRDAMTTHETNEMEIQYLYDYYKGKQPILERTKTVRAEINNTIVENRAHQIVDFKTGYLVGEPIQYTSRSEKKETAKGISSLNDYMVAENKAAKDKELADWQHICGTAYRMVLPSKDEMSESPFELFTLDPRTTFIIHSNEIARKPIAGVCYTVSKEGIKTYSVLTPERFFKIYDEKIVAVEDNRIGMIPIIEYQANKPRLGVFEPVLPLLDAVNNLDSNRLDGIEQFIQSLLVLYNCNIEEGTTAEDIRRVGMILLKSIGEAKADVKVIAEQLDQSQTQTLKKDLIDSIITIVGMPSQGDGNGSDSSNNGAMLLKQGWQTAEARAKDSELVFKRSEMAMLKVALRICNALGYLNLVPSEINIKFTRRNYEDIGSKSTVLTTMLGCDKVAPIDAFVVCGMFPDPEEACIRGLEWYEQNKAQAQEMAQQFQPNTEDDSVPEQDTQSEDK